MRGWILGLLALGNIGTGFAQPTATPEGLNPQQYVAKVVEATTRADYFDSIWHDLPKDDLLSEAALRKFYASNPLQRHYRDLLLALGRLVQDKKVRTSFTRGVIHSVTMAAVRAAQNSADIENLKLMVFFIDILYPVDPGNTDPREVEMREPQVRNRYLSEAQQSDVLEAIRLKQLTFCKDNAAGTE